MKPALKDVITYAGMGGAAAVLAAIGIVKGVDAKMLAEHPSFAKFVTSPWWYGLPLLLLAVVGIVRWVTRKDLAETADLDLEFYGDGRPPTGLRHVNVWRWYFYWTPSLHMNDTATGKDIAVVSAGSLLFVTFEPRVGVSNMYVSAKVPIPTWEVKQFNERFAIVTFAGLMPACTITVSVRPAPVVKS